MFLDSFIILIKSFDLTKQDKMKNKKLKELLFLLTYTPFFCYYYGELEEKIKEKKNGRTEEITSFLPIYCVFS